MRLPAFRPLLHPPSLRSCWGNLVYLTLLIWCASALGAGAKPNVLIVLVDDAGYGDFSCHGNPVLKTPNIDKLHGESVRFTDFHVSPMCTPTRGQLMTGSDALRNAASSVTAGRSFIRPEIPTLPEMLRAGGYRTGIFGKWHLGDSYPHRPMDRGFGTAVWLRGWGFTSAPEFANTLFDGECYRGDVRGKFSGYITDFCFDEAMKWMRERKNAREPFFCYLPLNAAHGPCIVAEKYSAPFGPKMPAKFFGMIANIDENMGRLDAFLRQSGLRDDTIVIFATDNGGTAGVRVFNAGLRGHKTEYYDGGHRVPCFVRWPAGGLRPAGDIDTPTEVQDLAPTLLDFCGVETPKSAHFDGADLADVMRGRAKLPDRMFVVQFGQAPGQVVPPEKWRSCVVWNQWRLVHGTELYDVRADRAQTHDLAAAKPEVVEKMRAHYEKWWAGIEPKLNDFIPLALGAGEQNPVELSSSDWQDTYADNAGHIRDGAGGPQGGPWNVEVRTAGEYEIAVSRWPFALNRSLTTADPEGGKAFPIAGGKLTIAGQQLTAKAQPGSDRLVFQAKLPAGRTQLHAWFQDEAGRDLCGAYYALIKRR